MQVMRERATTFSLAARFLPPAMRRDVGAIYAFFRMVDDAADRPGDRSPVEILEQLARWEVEIAGEAPPSPSVAPVLRVSARYDVPRALLSMVIEGARRDVEGQHIETMDDLRSYSLLVAGSVGMVMAHVLGAASRPALSAAAELGIAMQLTNVARDVGEDMAQGRCYLPAGLLTAAGTARQDLVEGRVTAGFVQVMQAVVGEARASFHPDCCPALRGDPRGDRAEGLRRLLHPGMPLCRAASRPRARRAPGRGAR